MNNGVANITNNNKPSNDLKGPKQSVGQRQMPNENKIQEAQKKSFFLLQNLLGNQEKDSQQEKQTQTLKDSEDEIRRLIAENDELRNSLQLYKRHLETPLDYGSKYAVGFHEVTEKLKKSEAGRKKLERQLREISNKEAERLKQHKETDNKAEDVRTENEKLKRHISKLSSQLEDTQKKLKASEERNEALQTDRKKVRREKDSIELERSSEIRQLREQLEPLKTAESKFKEAQARFENVHIQLSEQFKATERLEKQVANLKTRNKKLEVEKRSLEESAVTLTAENKRLLEQAGSLFELLQLQFRESAVLTAQIDELKMQTAEKDAQISDAENRLKIELEELEEETSVQIADLQNQLEKKEEKLAQETELRAKIDQLERENAEILKDKEGLNEAVEKSTSDVKLLEETKKTLEGEKDQLCKDNLELGEELKKIKAENSGLSSVSSEVLSLDAKNSELKGEVSRIQAELQTLAQENSDLVKSRDRLATENATLKEKERNFWQKALEVATPSKQNQREKTLEDQLRAAYKEKADLEGKIRHLEGECYRLETDNDNMRAFYTKSAGFPFAAESSIDDDCIIGKESQMSAVIEKQKLLTEEHRSLRQFVDNVFGEFCESLTTTAQEMIKSCMASTVKPDSSQMCECGREGSKPRNADVEELTDFLKRLRENQCACKSENVWLTEDQNTAEIEMQRLRETIAELKMKIVTKITEEKSYTVIDDSENDISLKQMLQTAAEEHKKRVAKLKGKALSKSHGKLETAISSLNQLEKIMQARNPILAENDLNGVEDGEITEST